MGPPGDCRVELSPIRRYATHDIGEQCRIGLAILIAVDLVAKPVTTKLAHDCFRVDLAIELELIKGLHCSEPGHAAPPTTAPLALIRPLTGRRPLYRCGHFPPWRGGASVLPTRGRRAPLRRLYPCARQRREPAPAPRFRLSRSRIRSRAHHALPDPGAPVRSPHRCDRNASS